MVSATIPVTIRWAANAKPSTHHSSVNASTTTAAVEASAATMKTTNRTNPCWASPPGVRNLASEAARETVRGSVVYG
jgi:hypothetical protein